jgi:hypothetical protein
MRILAKLSLHFSEVSTIFYEFGKFKLIFGIFKRITKFKNWKRVNNSGPHQAQGYSAMA